MRLKVLIVDEDPSSMRQLRRLLESDEFRVDTAAGVQEALRALEDDADRVVIADLRSPGTGGMALVREIAQRRLPATTIVTTAIESIERVVDAIRLGAADFLTWPIDPTSLKLVMERALRQRVLQDEVRRLRRELESSSRLDNILSRNPSMHAIFDLIRHVAGTRSTVLLEGETGTGKGLVARAIHQTSPERPGDLVAVNCAAFPETLLESELFGQEPGASGPAGPFRTGRFERAHQGTLVLDEISAISPTMQAKLLRVLEEGRFERVGGREALEVDVRVVAATRKDLEQLVREGRFREDLFYRLNVIKIDLPPLRDRPEDIPLLIGHFLDRHRRPDEPARTFAPEALERMLDYPWPGNVRELENAVERAAVTSVGESIGLDRLPERVRGRAGDESARVEIDLEHPLPYHLERATERIERQYILEALQRVRGNVGRCAKLCGLSRRSVSGKISRYAIDKHAFKSP